MIVTMAAKRIKGGKKLARFLQKAKYAKGVKDIKVGFFATSTYPDGTAVTDVALWNEFGIDSKTFAVRTPDGAIIGLRRPAVKRIPERPFFRRAIKRMGKPVLELLEAEVDTEVMVVSRSTADRAGAIASAEVQKSITRLKRPANAPATRELKKSSNPLIDTAFMRDSVTWKID